MSRHTDAFNTGGQVTVLHPSPEPHAPECANGCSGNLRGMFGPCQLQCAKTREFQEQCTRDAEANRLRFLTEIGANVLRAVSENPAPMRPIR